jgi:hypothetical protein
MSVLMALSVDGDPKKRDEYAASDPGEMQANSRVSEATRADRASLLGSEDGRIMVVDEWPDEQGFQSFFAENRERVIPRFEARA